MIKAPSSLQDLRRRIYHKAKSEKTHRFWGLFVHVAKLETLKRPTSIAKTERRCPWDRRSNICGHRGRRAGCISLRLYGTT